MSRDVKEATITRSGEIHFPTWVKLVSSLMGICFPFGVGLVGWGAVEIVELKMQVAAMRPQIINSEDYVTSGEATADKALLLTIINRNVADIAELQSLHDRRK